MAFAEHSPVTNHCSRRRCLSRVCKASVPTIEGMVQVQGALAALFQHAAYDWHYTHHTIVLPSLTDQALLPCQVQRRRSQTDTKQPHLTLPHRPPSMQDVPPVHLASRDLLQSNASSSAVRSPPPPPPPLPNVPAASITVVRTAAELQAAATATAPDIEVQAHLDLRSLARLDNPDIPGGSTPEELTALALLYKRAAMRSMRVRRADPLYAHACHLPCKDLEKHLHKDLGKISTQRSRQISAQRSRKRSRLNFQRRHGTQFYSFLLLGPKFSQKRGRIGGPMLRAPAMVPARQPAARELHRCSPRCARCARTPRAVSPDPGRQPPHCLLQCCHA